MLATVAALLLAAPQPGHNPAHEPALVTPPCDVQLRTIVEAQRTLAGLQRSERSLRRRRQAGGRVARLLHPIANQARALEAQLDAQERAYLRCVEAQLDAQAQPTSAPSDL